MSTVADKPKAPASARPSVEQELYDDGSRFDFYQAVSLLERTAKRPPTCAGVDQPSVRFVTPVSTSFPASAIESVERASAEQPATRLCVNFMGLTGPSGVLPRHYTELLVHLERRARGAAKRTLRAWYDLFNNRLIGQMYRAWARRRIDRGLEHGRGGASGPFTASLYSLVGMGLPALRDRQAVRDGTSTVDRVTDDALLRHAGAIARRRRSARQIESLLSNYFCAPVRIKQFRGQWLELAPDDRTRVGRRGRCHALGRDAVVGARVWNIQSRVRVVVGPLSRERFDQFLPDEARGERRRRFIMLCQLVRLALGPELDFDVQLVLQKDDVPRLKAESKAAPARLGWNAWLGARSLERDGDDPVFEPIERWEL